MKKHRMRTVVSIVSLLSFMIVAAPKASALISPLHWTFNGWAAGGAFPSLVPDPNVAGRLFLTSDVAGIWRSENSGEQWAFKTQGLANLITAFVAIAPSNSSVLYAPTNGGLHKSIDAGQTWTRLSSVPGNFTFYRPDSYRCVVVDRLDPNKVYAGTKNGEVFFSSNGGSSWSRVGTATYPFGQSGPISAVYLTRDSQTLFIGSNLGVRKCDLASGTWSAPGIAGGAATDIVGFGFTETVYFTLGNRVAWTTDKGASWQYSSVIPVGGISYRLAVSSEASGSIKILVGWRNGYEGGAVLSTNGGAGWTDIERNVGYDQASNPTRAWYRWGFGWPVSVAIDPNNSSVLYLTDLWGVFRTDNNGQSWFEKIKGTANVVGTDVIVTSTGKIFAASMDNGLLKSTDGGATYSTTITDNNVVGHVWRVVSKGNKVIATSSPWNVARHQLLISNDGGNTFTVTSNGLPQSYPTGNTIWWQSYPRGIAIDPQNPNKVYLGMDGDSGGGLFISNDGGYNWSRSSGQPGSLRIYNGLAIDPLEPNRLYWGATGSAGGVYRSENSGQSWTRVFSAATWVFDVATASDGKVYAAADSAGPSLYVSSNKGASWTLLRKFPGTFGSCEAITIDPNNPNRIAVGSVFWSGNAPGKAYLTEDGGVTWTDITADLPDGDGPAAMAFTNDGSALFMTRYAGSVYRLQLTGGTQDTQAPSAPTNLQAVQSGNQANLTWGASTDNIVVTGYQVLRDGQLLTTVLSTSYSDSSITAGATYSYIVRALDAAGNNSSPSNTVTLTVGTALDTAAPTVPTGLTATLSGLQVSLSWGASTDNTGVLIYEVRHNGTSIGTSVSTTFLHSGTAGATYNYTVVAKDAAGNTSGSSNIVTVTIPPILPGGPSAPTNLTVTLVSGPQVQLSWSAPPSATSYNVYRNDVFLKYVTASSTFDNEVIPGNVYRYKIQAYDADGLPSPYSSEQSVTVPAAAPVAPTAPTNLTASVVGSQVQLSWNAPAAATSYNVYRNDVWRQYVLATSYSDTGLTVGATYRYKIQAYGSTGLPSPYSSEVSVTVSGSAPPAAGPTAPTNLVANIVGSQVQLTWTSPPTATSYNVYRNDAWRQYVLTPSYSDAGVTQGSTYLYKIQAYDAAGLPSPYSSEVSVTVSGPTADTTAPSTPSNLTASLSGTTANLSWSASTDNVGVTGYRVFNGTTQLTTVTSTSYAAAGLMPSQTHSFTVRAIDAAGNVSNASNTASVTVPASLPSTPTNLIATMQDANTAYIAWSSSTNAAGYELQRNNAFLKNVTGVSTTDATVAAGQTYSYQVRAFNASNDFSGLSNSMSVTAPAAPDTTVPSTPSNLVASLVGTTANLIWNAATDNVAVTGYRVFQGTTQLATVTGTSYAVTSLEEGQTHSFTVRAIDAAGNVSNASNTASVTVPVAAPAAPTAPTNFVVNVVGSQAQLSWNAPPTATSYNVYRNDVWRQYVLTTSYSDTGLTVGATYRYKIQAHGSTGLPSPFSSEVSVTVPGPTADTTAPSAPSNLAAFLSGTTANLTWSASTDNVAVTGYQVFQGATLKGTTASLSYAVTGLAAGQTHSFTIKAVDAANNVSASSNTASVTVPLPPDTTVPSTPSNLTVSLSGTTANLSWAASTDNVGVTGYRVFNGTTQLATVTSTSYAAAGLAPGQTHNFTVRAIDAAGNVSNASNSASVTVPLAGIPTAPTALVGSYVGSAVSQAKTVYLDWTPGANNIGYEMYRNGIYRKTISEPSTTDSVGKGVFKFKVRAFDASGNFTAYSNEITIDTR